MLLTAFVEKKTVRFKEKIVPAVGGISFASFDAADSAPAGTDSNS